MVRVPAAGAGACHVGQTVIDEQHRAGRAAEPRRCQRVNRWVRLGEHVAFLHAGDRAVLATHWAVESNSAAALSTATFKAQSKGGVSRSESLRQAQLAMIDGSLGEGLWRHPFYWAPYALFGDPVR